MHARVVGIGFGLLLAMIAPAAAMSEGATLPAVLSVPFAGLLLSIALLPLLTPSLWHHHYGKIAAAWSALTLVGFAISAGSGAAAGHLAETVIAEYLPFLILVGSLYIVAGGLLVTGNPARQPGRQYGDPRHRRRARQPHRHHRRLHGADPAADPRQ